MTRALSDRIRDLLDQHVPLTATEEALLKELHAPQPPGPTIPPARSLAHPGGCWCVECHNAGQRYADYLHAKRMNEL